MRAVLQAPRPRVMSAIALGYLWQTCILQTLVESGQVPGDDASNTFDLDSQIWPYMPMIVWSIVKSQSLIYLIF